MNISSDTIASATQSLMSRRMAALSLCKWCVMGSFVWAGGYVSTTTGADGLVVFLILTLGCCIVPLLYGVFCWFNEFFFIRRIFTDLLLHLDEKINKANESPSLKRANFRMYGSYKALLILFRERQIVSWVLTGTSIATAQFILPALVLGYMVWLRFFCIDKFASIELEFLRAFESSPAVKAVFDIESTESFNATLEALIDLSKNRAA